jgi:DNA (cytosine-5)-methyltransferase 1
MGLPQRRERVYLLASKEGDPKDVLFVDDAGEPERPDPSSWRSRACGFYWTEGLRGLGWAYDAVPTLKGGSTIGIPSPPAIVLPEGRIVLPDIRDAERMQGFPEDWTEPTERVTRRGHRWKLVGNAVTVAVSAWLGGRLVEPGRYDPAGDELLQRHGAWPRSAWGEAGKRYVSSVSAWPCHLPSPPLEDFLRFPTTRLSPKAAAGFYSRAQKAKLRFPPGFLEIVQRHLDSP